MAYTRKALRASNAVNDPRFAQAMRYAHKALNGTQYETVIDENGYEQKVRIWGNEYEDCTTAEDVRRWLSGARVVDLEQGLEYCRPSFIKAMVKDGYLRKDKLASWYWITAKAAEKWKLEPVLGCKFPK